MSVSARLTAAGIIACEAVGLGWISERGKKECKLKAIYFILSMFSVQRVPSWDCSVCRLVPHLPQNCNQCGKHTRYLSRLSPKNSVITLMILNLLSTLMYPSGLIVLTSVIYWFFLFLHQVKIFKTSQSHSVAVDSNGGIICLCWGMVIIIIIMFPLNEISPRSIRCNVVIRYMFNAGNEYWSEGSQKIISLW